MDRLSMGQNNRLKFLENEELLRLIPEGAGVFPAEAVSISAKIFDSSHPKHAENLSNGKCVLVNHLGTQILININSIQKNTFATEEQIREALAEGKLIEFITLSIAIKRFSVPQEQPLVMQAIRENKFLNLTRSNPALRSICIELVIGLNEKGEVDLLRLGQTVGKGTYSKAVEIINLTDGYREVIKSGKKSRGDQGVQDVIREYGKDEKIFKGKKILGLRTPHTQLTQIPLLTKQALRENATITRDKIVSRNQCYDCNFMDDVESNPGRSLETYLPDFYQMFYVLHYMKEARMTHGDIKGNNFLVKYIDGFKFVHLSDLGDMQCYADLQPGERIAALTSGTQAFTVLKEKQLFSSLLAVEDQTPDLIAIIESLQGKRDVFAMATTMYVTLAGVYPYPLDEQGYPVEGSDYQMIPTVSRGFNDLLREMLNFDIDLRPDGNEAWDEFLRLLDADHPEIHQKMLGDIEALGYEPPEIDSETDTETVYK
jgi:hypothetical protein